MSNNSSYASKAQITTIRATSRASIKVKDSFYTVEYSEERAIPEVSDIDIEAERSELWSTVNNEVDNQITEIVTAFN